MRRTRCSTGSLLAAVVAAGIALSSGPAGAVGFRTAPSGHAGLQVKSPVKPGHVGATAVISDATGAKADVTLVKVIDPGKPTSPYGGVPAADRYVGLDVKIVGVSTKALFPAADATINVTVTGSNDHTYKSVTAVAQYEGDLVGCKNLTDGKLATGAGQTVSGCIIFALPRAVKLAKVVYSEPAGTRAQWMVP